MADKENKKNKKKAQEAQEAQETQETEPQEGAEAAEQPEALQQLQEKLDAEHEAHLRLAAEYDNFRKRTQKEKDASYANGKADAIGKLLPVYDNLERALNPAHRGRRLQKRGGNDHGRAGEDFPGPGRHRLRRGGRRL
ncbi:MAG: nucleotide exchange factor GrpE [Oscillospiraceae bacterium]